MNAGDAMATLIIQHNSAVAVRLSHEPVLVLDMDDRRTGISSPQPAI